MTLLKATSNSDIYYLFYVEGLIYDAMCAYVTKFGLVISLKGTGSGGIRNRGFQIVYYSPKLNANLSFIKAMSCMCMLRKIERDMTKEKKEKNTIFQV